jgi:hypothetical protein
LRHDELKLPDHQPVEAPAGRVCKREFSIFRTQDGVPLGLQDDLSANRSAN